MTEFRQTLTDQWPGLESSQIDQLEAYYHCVIDENQKQNLTRLTTPRDFIEGHLLDIRALTQVGDIEYPALDMGSGAGVPGIPAAIVLGGAWIVSDSESSKADFLSRAVHQLGLKNVRVTNHRAELFLRDVAVTTVISRAVGPVSRIYNWLKDCSTWNNLILFKGPRWEEEWATFRTSSGARDLTITNEFRYTVGAERKNRIIVRLARR